MNLNSKKLYRSRRDRKLAGVCGGLAVYFGIDPTWIRLAFGLGIIVFGMPLLIYLVMWICIPLEPVIPVAPK